MQHERRRKGKQRQQKKFHLSLEALYEMHRYCKIERDSAAKTHNEQREERGSDEEGKASLPDLIT